MRLPEPSEELEEEEEEDDDDNEEELYKTQTNGISDGTVIRTVLACNRSKRLRD